MDWTDKLENFINSRSRFTRIVGGLAICLLFLYGTVLLFIFNF